MNNQIPTSEYIRTTATLLLCYAIAWGAAGLADLITGVAA